MAYSQKIRFDSISEKMSLTLDNFATSFSVNKIFFALSHPLVLNKQKTKYANKHQRRNEECQRHNRIMKSTPKAFKMNGEPNVTLKYANISTANFPFHVPNWISFCCVLIYCYG